MNYTIKVYKYPKNTVGGAVDLWGAKFVLDWDDDKDSLPELPMDEQDVDTLLANIPGCISEDDTYSIELMEEFTAPDRGYHGFAVEMWVTPQEFGGYSVSARVNATGIDFWNTELDAFTDLGEVDTVMEAYQEMKERAADIIKEYDPAALTFYYNDQDSHHGTRKKE